MDLTPLSPEVVEEGPRGKPGGITDQDEVFSVSVIKGLAGQGEDLTIIRHHQSIRSPEPSPRVALAESLWTKATAIAVMARAT